jgi:hypothetical protein
MHEDAIGLGVQILLGTREGETLHSPQFMLKHLQEFISVILVHDPLRGLTL